MDRVLLNIRNPEEDLMLIWAAAADNRPRHFLLLDRDGIINADRPDYIKHRSEFCFFDEALEALRWLHEHGVGCVLISNQSGLNRGFIPWEDFWDVHACLIDGVREAGGNILGAFYCPHRPEEGCACRKPQPGMVRAAAEYFQIPLAETYFIGDRETDLVAASRAGCLGVLLDRSGDLARVGLHGAAGGPMRSFGSLTEAVRKLFDTRTGSYGQA